MESIIRSVRTAVSALSSLTPCKAHDRIKKTDAEVSRRRHGAFIRREPKIIQGTKQHTDPTRAEMQMQMAVAVRASRCPSLSGRREVRSLGAEPCFLENCIILLIYGLHVRLMMHVKRS